jgi:hypothetical protein
MVTRNEERLIAAVGKMVLASVMVDGYLPSKGVVNDAWQEAEDLFEEISPDWRKIGASTFDTELATKENLARVFKTAADRLLTPDP